MRKRITLLATALVMALMMSLGGMAFAVNSSSCTFEKGTTTCTTIHGSHGSTDTHNGQVGSNGKDTGGSTGKVTGSDHTIQ